MHFNVVLDIDPDSMFGSYGVEIITEECVTFYGDN